MDVKRVKIIKNENKLVRGNWWVKGIQMIRIKIIKDKLNERFGISESDIMRDLIENYLEKLVKKYEKKFNIKNL